VKRVTTDTSASEIDPNRATLANLERERRFAAMNDRHAVVSRGGSTFVATFGYNPAHGRRADITYSKFQDLRDLYANQFVPAHNGEGAVTSLGKAWLTWAHRKTYKQVVFAPGQQLGEDTLNLWQGFAVHPRKGSWTRYATLIRDVICSGNDEYYNYLLNWMARAVQQPGAQGEVAIVLRGERGAGKSTFIGTFGRLFAPHYLQISSAQHLTGTFNLHLETCALLFLDEAMWAGDHQGESTLKALITEPTIAIRSMRTNMYQAPNCLHIMMATNSEWAVPAGMKERRYFVLDCSSRHLQDTDYFGAIRHEMDNGGLEALLHDLQTRDLSTFNVRTIPHTDALREQQVLSLNPAETWWYDKLHRGEITEDTGMWPTEIPRSELHADYVRVLGMVGVKRRATETSLGILLGKLVPGLRRRRGSWLLPSLASCRQEWDRLMRTVTRWDDEEDELKEAA
jgi:hypothetical protein